MNKFSSFVAGKKRLRHYFRLVPVVGAVAALASVGQTVQAADSTESTWNGGSTSWTTPGNWSPNGVPSATVAAVFNTQVSNEPTITGSAATAVQGIWVTGSGVTGNANSLTTITNSGTGTVGVTAATLDGVTASILLDGTGNNSLTMAGNTKVTGNVLVDNAGTLTFSGALQGVPSTTTFGGTNALGVINIANMVQGLSLIHI